LFSPWVQPGESIATWEETIANKEETIAMKEEGSFDEDLCL